MTGYVEASLHWQSLLLSVSSRCRRVLHNKVAPPPPRPLPFSISASAVPRAAQSEPSTAPESALDFLPSATATDRLCRRCRHGRRPCISCAASTGLFRKMVASPAPSGSPFPAVEPSAAMAVALVLVQRPWRLLCLRRRILCLQYVSSLPDPLPGQREFLCLELTAAKSRWVQTWLPEF